MATESCKCSVDNTKSIQNIKEILLKTACQRTFQVTSGDLDKELPYLEMYRKASIGAMAKINALFEFIRGDLSQDIYNGLIYNQYNMNADELNNMFRVSGIKNMCEEVSNSENIKLFFGPIGNLNTEIRTKLNQFMIRRNEISHSNEDPTKIYSTNSDIKFFKALIMDICLVPESKFE